MMICIKSAKDDSNNVNTATLVYFSRNPSIHTAKLELGYKKKGQIFKVFPFLLLFCSS